MQGIEGMEKFLLCPILSYNKLNVINQENVVGAIFFPEFCRRKIIFVPDRFDQLICKCLACDILYLRTRK